MRSLSAAFRRLYGEHVLHLIVLIGALALAAYTVSVLGVASLFNPDVWWQSIAVWFAVAVIGHDLVLFPLYALAERLLPVARHRTRADDHAPARKFARLVPVVNYLRMPTLATGLTFLLFFPGIIEQGAQSYRTATGLTQEPFLDRWLLLTAAFYFTSAVCYVAKSVVVNLRSAKPADASPAEPVSEPSSTGGD